MRTDIAFYDHYEGVLDALKIITQFRIGEGEAPKDATDAFVDPPYAVLYFISGGDQDGPISDSQADVELTFQVTAVGRSVREALTVMDYCSARMKRENVTVTGRKVRNLKKFAASNGAQRDDAVATPVYYCFQRWILDTTPA